MTVCEYKPGLEGIPAAQSSISYVDGQKEYWSIEAFALKNSHQKVPSWKQPIY
jgi:citrate synthase